MIVVAVGLFLKFIFLFFLKCLISTVLLCFYLILNFILFEAVVLLDSPLRWVEPPLIELNASRRFNESATGF